MDKIKILKVESGKPPCVKEIANDFKASQAEVEGDIECVGFGDGCVAVINAEGKLNGMQPNRRNGDDIICGPFFICGDTPDGDFISLTEQQIEEYTRRFGGADTAVYAGVSGAGTVYRAGAGTGAAYDHPRFLRKWQDNGKETAQTPPCEPACGNVCRYSAKLDKVTD